MGACIIFNTVEPLLTTTSDERPTHLGPDCIAIQNSTYETRFAATSLIRITDSFRGPNYNT